MSVGEQSPESVHVHVALGAPVLRGDVAEPGANQDQRRVPVGEGADNPGAATHLSDHALEWIIGPQVAPVFGGEGKVAEGLRRVLLHVVGRHRQLHLPEFGHHLAGLLLRG